MRAIADSSGGDVDVPAVWSDLCTSHLLVMEELDGVPLSRAGDRLDPLSSDEKSALAGVLFDSVLNQIALHGVFHADLHPGNIVVSGTDTEPHLALLDFGSVGRLGRADREALGLLLIAFDLDDSVAATDALTMLLGSPEEFARRDFERQIGALMLRGSTSTDLFTDLARLLSTCGFRIPPMIAAAFRAMATLEGSLRLIDAEFDLIEAVRSRTGSSIRDVVENADVRAEVESQVAAALPLIRRLPQRVDRIVTDLEAGRFTVSVEPLSSLVDRTLLRSLVREATAALICAVLAVCGVALIITNGGPTLAGVVHTNGYVGGVLALVAFLVGARVLVVGIIDRDPAPS